MVEIRKAVDADIDAIKELDSNFTYPWSRGLIQSKINDDRYLFLVAETEGEVVGWFSGLKYETMGAGFEDIDLRHNIHAEKITVTKDKRYFDKHLISGNVAKLLFDEVMSLYETMTLNVKEGNRVKSIYDRMGFKELESQGTYSDGQRKIPMVLTRKNRRLVSHKELLDFFDSLI